MLTATTRKSGKRKASAGRKRKVSAGRRRKAPPAFPREYKGVWIFRVFPSGYYQFRSDNDGTTYTFDTLAGAKAHIKNDDWSR